MIDKISSGEAFDDVMKDIGNIYLDTVIYNWNLLPSIQNFAKFIWNMFTVSDADYENTANFSISRFSFIDPTALFYMRLMMLYLSFI